MEDGISKSDLLNEGLKSLSSLARLIPSRRRKGPISPKALWRWATKGVTLPDGSKLRLETVRLAGSYLSTEAALQRFITRQQTHTNTGWPPVPVPVRNPNKRQREAELAAQRLDAIGI